MNNPHFHMPNVQVLVADASRARFFTLDSPRAELQELRAEVHPQGRLHAKDLATESAQLTTDKPGRQRDPMTSQRSAMEERTEPKAVEAQRFARKLVEGLEQDWHKGKLEKLYLVAPPSFLGVLRKELTHNVATVVADEIPKDLTQKDAGSVRQHLPEFVK